MALRGIDADLGRGAYDLLSLTMSFGGNFAFGTGISSATSITGLSVILFFEFSLSFEAAGETGV